MKDFDALKDIWIGQKSLPKVNYEEVLLHVKKNKAGYLNKLIAEAAIMGVVVAFLVAVWVFRPIILWTSHLSLFMLVSCCLYYLFVQFRDYKGISSTDTYLDQPEKYITYLKTYRKRRYMLNTQTYAAYSITLGIAFVFYFMEVFVAAPLWQTIVAAALTFVWFVVCAYLMRSYRKREQLKLSEIIFNLEKLEKQFEN